MKIFYDAFLLVTSRGVATVTSIVRQVAARLLNAAESDQHLFTRECMRRVVLS